MCEYSKESLFWLAENLPKVQAMLRKTVCGAPLLRDDAFDEVVLPKVHGVFARYDSSKGTSLDAWMLTALKRFVIDWLQHRPKSISITYDIPAISDRSADYDILDVLEAVGGESADLLRMHFVYGMSMQEIADYFVCGKATIVRKMNLAKERAKQKMGVD